MRKRGERGMHKKWLGVVIGVFVVGWLGSSFAADLKVGCVDIQRAVNECNAGKEAKKSLMKEVEKFQGLVQQKQKDLQTMKETLEKQAPMLTADARTAREKEYQGKLREFQRWGEDNQNDLNQRRTEMERNIAVGLYKVIKKIGEDEGFSLVLERNETIVLFSSKTLDITDRVIKAFDAQKK
jgi:outer membrane protein